MTGVGRAEVSSGNQRYHSGEALTEWKSSELLENEVPSTSPPFWDMDDDNDDGGQRPSQLYGKYTWTIYDFFKINKRELRSNAFEVGGYKWYILIYPKGCDVCNHLSLFLCVANHDKLLPGWSHFAQFTIAVVNKDPKRTKYSDTLHRFWKKEHDWGWKKFMELSKVMDGFIDANSLVIKVQIQVIRERADRPFRCLGCQYRRELIRVYLTNVETICRRFVEARRTKLGRLIEDKAEWKSFCIFWSKISQKTKHLISKEKSDAVLRAAVKHFFVVKEVSSTLVMDSLYSGLKCLEWMSKNKTDREKLTNTGELVVPMVLLEKDMFILADDVLPLVERAATEPLPPKDDKGPQNRTKDGCSGEDLIKDSVEYDERRLTELGRRTIEIFALENIFSKIEIAYQEAVSLIRQEELIREEEAEAAFLAGSEHKAKRGIEREKKSKKKQAKHKRKGRKKKGGNGMDQKTNVVVVVDKVQEISDPHGSNEFTLEAEHGCENPITIDALSDSSDSLDCVTEALQLDSDDDRGSSPVCWDTGTSDIPPLAESIISEVTILDPSQNGKGKGKIPSSMDDSSSTCSTDSLPSVVRNVSHREYLQTSQGTPKQPVRNDSKANSTLHGWPSETVIDSVRLCDAKLDSVPQSFPKPVKKEEVAPRQRNLSKGIPSQETTTRRSSLPICPPQNLTTKNVSVGKRPMLAGPTRCMFKPDLVEAKEPKPIQKPSVQQVPVIPSFQKPSPLFKPVLVEAKEPKPIQKPSVMQVPVIPSFQTPSPLFKPVLVEAKEPKPIQKPSVQQVPVISSIQKPSPLFKPDLVEAKEPKPIQKPSVQQVPVIPSIQKPSSVFKPDLVEAKEPKPIQKPSVQQVQVIPSFQKLSPLFKPDLVEAKEPKPIQKPSVQQVQVIPSFQKPSPLFKPNLVEAKEPKPIQKPSVQQVPVIPSFQTPSPLFKLDLVEAKEPMPIQKPSVQQVPVIPSFQTPLPLLERSVSAAGRLGSEPSAHAPAYIPQLSRPNAIVGNSGGFPQYYPSDLGPQSSIQIARNSSIGMMRPPLSSAMPTQRGYDTGRQTTQNASMLEFPHLDIINDLLDEENVMGRVSSFANNEHHNLNRQFSFPGYTRMWGVDTETSSTNNHDYISSPLTHYGQLDREYQRRHHGFVGNQWQNGETEVTARMGMRNSEPDGLFHGGIPDYRPPPYARHMYRGPNPHANANGYGLFRPSNGH